VSKKPSILLNSGKIASFSYQALGFQHSIEISYQNSLKKSYLNKEISSPLQNPNLLAPRGMNHHKTQSMSIGSQKNSLILVNLDQSCDESSSVVVISDISSESDSEEKLTQIGKFSKEIFCLVLEDYFKECFEGLVEICIEELICAYLSLFSSKLLFKLVNEIVDTITPKVVQIAFDEESEAAYSEIKDQILSEILSQELSRLLNDFNLELISLEIMKDNAKLLPIKEIVEESVEEERLWQDDFADSIYFSIVDLNSEGEWLELLVEDEIIIFRIEEIWKSFPKELAKDITKNKNSMFLDRLTEYVWYGLLNFDLSETWLYVIVNDALNDTCTFDTMPLKSRSGKKSETLFNKFL
jgi:hypothetical protein